MRPVYKAIEYALASFGILILVTQLAGCAGARPGAGYVDDMPDEIERLVKKEYGESLWAVGSATGPEEDLAVRKAVLQARAEIARKFRAQVDVLQKSYEEAVNRYDAQEYQQTIEIFASLEIAGLTVAKTMVRNEKGRTFSAKALVVVSAEQLKALFDEKMQAYTSFRASQAYRELEERVEREKERKNKKL